MTNTADSPVRQRAPWWFNLAGQLLQPWVRIRRDPAEPASLLQAGVPVCYVIERDGFSDALILQRACREAGLPNPMQPLTGTRRRRSVFALTRRDGWVFGRNRKRAAGEPLRQLVRSLEGMPERDIQIVPVSIYVGRAPSRDSGWFRVLFSENWVMVGRFRRHARAAAERARHGGALLRAGVVAQRAGRIRRDHAGALRAQDRARAAHPLPPHPRRGDRAGSVAPAHRGRCAC